MAAEAWRPVVGFEGLYDVSDQGRVRSWNPRRGLPAPQIMQATVDGKGYRRVTLSRGGRYLYRRVHVLVAESFIGPRPIDREVRHLNGDQSDPALSNLTYGTHAQNMADRVAHGTDPNASKAACDRGHLFDATNTHVTREGFRHCRACRRENTRAYRARLKEALVG